MNFFRIGIYSLFVSSLLSLTGRTAIITLGDSITFGSNATTTNERYANQFATAQSLTLTNLGVGGRGVLEAASQINAAAFTRPVTVISFMAGLNDIRRNGSAVKTLKKGEACLRSVILRGLSNVNTPAGSSGVTRTGTTTGYAGNTVGGIYGSGTQPCTCASNGANNAATWTWTFTGTAFGIQFFGSDNVVSAYAIATVQIDGVTVDAIDLDSWYDGVSDGSKANNVGPVAFTWHGLTNTSHTIRVISNADGNCPIDYFCTINTPDNSPAYIIADIPYLDATGYATAPANGSTAASDAMSTVFRSIVNEYRSLGYNIVSVPTNSFYDVSTGLDPADHIHPNNLGHDQITNAFNSVIQ